MYSIEPERRTLHGTFSRDLAPVLTIDSGATVVFRTLDAGWWLEGQGVSRAKFEPRDPERDAGHALCGPVFVRGAEPGMTLAVEIKDLQPGSWGWQAACGWPSEFNQRLGADTLEVSWLEWQLDASQQVWRNQSGHEVVSRPFMGVMGMPPDAPGLHSTSPPRVTGGNLDCKELTAGSTLYLPIAVPGGLFSVGDGHGVQGDGEVSGTAIECPMERVELTFRLLPELHLATPRAEVAGGWITLGFDEDLDEAMYCALEGMLALMEEKHGLTRRDALALASLVVDLRVTQIVNGVKGVHAFLPHGALAGLSKAISL